MPSPFPGMDPYLEGYLWADVHNALASKMRQQLTPQLRPRYTARLEIYLVEDPTPEAEVGILYPDIEVLQRRDEIAPLPQRSGIATTPAPITLPVLEPVEVRIPSIEIRDTANNTLVTSIEILSPVNKREPGLSQYRQKRQKLYQSGVHLIELDLLRRGTRAYQHPRLADSSYVITLMRGQSRSADFWTLALCDRLPILPVPLRSPDPDVALDLSTALQEIYDEAAYDLSINYQELPPPPALSTADALFLDSVLH